MGLKPSARLYHKQQKHSKEQRMHHLIHVIPTQKAAIRHRLCGHKSKQQNEQAPG